MIKTLRSIVSENVVAAFRSLPRHIKKILIAGSAQSTGIWSFQYDGGLGPFQGAAGDKGVFLEYVLKDNWAPEIQSLLVNLFPAGEGTYVDIGANIGLTTIPIGRKTGVTCHAFEMEEQNFLFLTYNIWANGVTANVRAYRYALFSEDTELEMEICEENRGDHRVRLGNAAGNAYGERNRRTRKVPARRLDSILAKEDLVAPVVMKVDVQGAEVDVLRGAGDLLAEVDFIILEFWPYGLARLEHTPEEVFALLGGFESGAVIEEGKPTPSLSPIEDVFRIARSIPVDGSSPSHLDLFLARKPV